MLVNVRNDIFLGQGWFIVCVFNHNVLLVFPFVCVTADLGVSTMCVNSKDKKLLCLVKYTA